jgi:hypothetical protein
MNEIDALRAEKARLKAFIAAVHCRLTYGPKFTEATRLTIIDECEKETHELKNFGTVHNAKITGRKPSINFNEVKNV